ncbi:unnamed protein product, partial [Iphiclides podalirius]
MIFAKQRVKCEGDRSGVKAGDTGSGALVRSTRKHEKVRGILLRTDRQNGGDEALWGKRKRARYRLFARGFSRAAAADVKSSIRARDGLKGETRPARGGGRRRPLIVGCSGAARTWGGRGAAGARTSPSRTHPTETRTRAEGARRASNGGTTTRLRVEPTDADALRSTTDANYASRPSPEGAEAGGARPPEPRSAATRAGETDRRNREARRAAGRWLRGAELEGETGGRGGGRRRAHAAERNARRCTVPSASALYITPYGWRVALARETRSRRRTPAEF